MKQIIHAVHIHAAPAAVYRSITTKAGLQGWWTNSLKLLCEKGVGVPFTPPSA